MSEDKKVKDIGEYRTPTCPEWLTKVDRDLEALVEGRYVMEEKRPLNHIETHFLRSVEHLREAVMSLAMEVAHLKKINEEQCAGSSGKKSMGRKPS